MSDFRSAAETDLGILKLRTMVTDVDARLTEALGFLAPHLGSLRSDKGIDCTRIGPYEWLILGPTDALAAAQGRLATAFDDGTALLIDMSHGSRILRIEGADAIERINSCCDLDFAAFAGGTATRTRFGDIAVVLIRHDDSPLFRLIADQSYADYLDLLLSHGVAVD